MILRLYGESVSSHVQVSGETRIIRAMLYGEKKVVYTTVSTGCEEQLITSGVLQGGEGG